MARALGKGEHERSIAAERESAELVVQAEAELSVGGPRRDLFFRLRDLDRAPWTCWELWQLRSGTPVTHVPLFSVSVASTQAASSSRFHGISRAATGELIQACRELLPKRQALRIAEAEPASDFLAAAAAADTPAGRLIDLAHAYAW